MDNNQHAPSLLLTPCRVADAQAETDAAMTAAEHQVEMAEKHAALERSEEKHANARHAESEAKRLLHETREEAEAREAEAEKRLSAAQEEVATYCRLQFKF